MPAPLMGEEGFRLLVEGVEDLALFMLGPDGRVASWNAGGERITGYSAEEVRGVHFSRAYTEEDLAAGLPQRVLDEASARDRARTEGWRVRKDGSRFYALTHYTAIRDADGRLLGFAGMTRDLTARREMEARLREALESLRRNETLSKMGALVAGVAHEVRNPLFGISATLDALEAQHGERPETASYLSVLRREVARLHQLMHGLLTYGRSSSIELHPRPLSGVLDEAVDATSALARERGVHVEVRVAPDLPRVPMEPSRLALMFQNLLANALQHSPGGTTVRLTARLLTGEGLPRVECLVMDEGPGFPPQERTRVFEPFYSRRPGGVGLGLSIVQRIVEAHHGTVSVGNVPEGGAEVRVCLPTEGKPDAATDSGGR